MNIIEQLDRQLHDFGRNNTFFWFVAQKNNGALNPAGWPTALLQALARHDPPP